MSNIKISKIVRFLKKGDFLSFNEQYNLDVHGFSSQEYKEIMHIVSDLYGMRSMWGNRIKISEIKKQL